MCIGPFAPPKPKNIAPPPAIAPRQDTNTSLPVKKDVVPGDTKANVSYGTGQKKSSPAAGKKTGADQLKIKLNEGDSVGSTTGGLNV
mgnify:CR=1 FL=1|tara:strand:- start:187 stop:447 length:261 start_codon:yes stop_codon:yes gene_type:complete